MKNLQATEVFGKRWETAFYLHLEAAFLQFLLEQAEHLECVADSQSLTV